MVSIDGAIVLLAFVCGIIGVILLTCYCRLSSRRYRTSQSEANGRTNSIEINDEIEMSQIDNRHQRTITEILPEYPPPPYETAITDQWENRDGTLPVYGPEETVAVNVQPDLMPPPYSLT